MTKDLFQLQIGPLCHSRWLTTANRFMKIWVSKDNFTAAKEKENPQNLRLIVEFIVGVYVPMWFQAKVKHSFISGPDHVLRQLQLV